MEGNTIHSVSDYLSVVDRLKRQYPNNLVSNNPIYHQFLFRGHSDKRYKLLPGLFRTNGEHKEYLTWGTEQNIINQFILEASVYLKIPKDDYVTWLEYAQHYGVPTRLLDWTENPLVALYFACKDKNDKDGEIWILNKINYNSYINKIDDSIFKIKLVKREAVNSLFKNEFKPKYPFVYLPYYVDSRMSAQSSFFMAWGTTETPLEEMFSEEKNQMKIINGNVGDDGFKSYESARLDEFIMSTIIPADRKQAILHELDTIGINEKTLFPGIDGIGRYVERLYRFDFNEYLQNML
ncbi:FRG domain-containing protein [Pseudobutyrivibrio sp. OR37]|uniref:FRG domain-containing protein n=1 Tax=Pseudobutyrivibrio sp. OR37 TaxID=1798186 RepID=UPI0008E082EB|nr:FRG domain-containing protein [Pseudobutyrivibrio sp. OR37]SFH76245.1 FRG domain-containing protein [Pseudobutyrivibrio sp. OR37]